MKDLKIYYITDDGENAVDSNLEKAIEIITDKYGLEFYGSGVEIGKKIRDLHYRKKK